MKKRRPLDQVEKLGDMTSMIDVVFLLLIFFILMPFKTSESRIESHLPKDSGQSAAKSEEPPVEKIDVRIAVSKTEKINVQEFKGVSVTINGKATSFSGLKNRFSELRAGVKGDISKTPVELNADEDVPFYFVLKALDYAKLNKFTFIKYPAPPVLNWGKKPRRNDDK